jgi:hypothetical protein
VASAVKINLKELNREADRIAKDLSTTRDNVATCVVQFALLIETESKEMIQKSSPTGRTYRRGKTVTHRASAPGEPPSTDTGRLVSSIRPAFYGEFSAEVGALQNIAKYGGYLETGTSRMGARPWLKPTLENNSSRLAGFLDAAIKSGGLV